MNLQKAIKISRIRNILFFDLFEKKVSKCVQFKANCLFLNHKDTFYVILNEHKFKTLFIN